MFAYIFSIHRLNEDLCAMEVRLKISQRWQPGHIEYQTALLNQEEAKKLEMLHKIRLLAVERDFLVGVRSKYSGKCGFNGVGKKRLNTLYSISQLYIVQVYCAELQTILYVSLCHV